MSSSFLFIVICPLILGGLLGAAGFIVGHLYRESKDIDKDEAEEMPWER